MIIICIVHTIPAFPDLGLYLVFYDSRKNATTLIFNDLPHIVNERKIKLNFCPRVTC